MSARPESLFPVPDVTPELNPLEIARRGEAIGHIFIAAGYIAAMESAMDSISESEAQVKSIVLGGITNNWLRSDGERLLISAGYQVFHVDGVFTKALDNYDWPPEEQTEDQNLARIADPFGNIDDTQAHPRITFEELRDRTQEAIANLTPPSQDPSGG